MSVADFVLISSLTSMSVSILWWKLDNILIELRWANRMKEKELKHKKILES